MFIRFYVLWQENCCLDALQSKSFDEISSRTVTSLTAVLRSNKNKSIVHKTVLLYSEIK